MKDIYTETVVPIVPDSRDQVKKRVYIILLAASCFLVLYDTLLFLIPVLFFAVLLYRVWQRSDREYEYVHTNDVFDIDLVIRSSKRKALVSVKLDEVILVAPSNADEILQYREVKMHDYTGGNTSRISYAMICARDGKYAKVLLDLDRNMISSLKQWIPSKVQDYT